MLMKTAAQSLTDESPNIDRVAVVKKIRDTVVLSAEKGRRKSTQPWRRSPAWSPVAPATGSISAS